MTIRSSSLPRMDIMFLAVAAIVLFVHSFFILTAAVNVPHMDEWEALAPRALDRNLHLSWLFGFHNEHRIVLTKLQTWILYRLGGWTQHTQLICNLGIYVCIWCALWCFVKEQLSTSLDFLPVLGLSAVAAENHISGFQGQFHFFLLFFVLAIWFGTRGPGWGWAGAFSAVLSAYSFSSGVICAAFCIGLYLYFAWSRQSGAWAYFAQAALIAVAVAPWFIGFKKNPYHPRFTLPWTGSFWTFLLNEIALGFGFTTLDVFPGVVVLAILIPLALVRFLAVWNNPRLRDVWVAWITFGVCIVVCLAVTTLSRAGFGIATSKHGRFGEIAMMLPPVLWVLVKERLRRYEQRLRVSLNVLFGILLITPFLDDFHFHDAYFGIQREVRLEDRKCIQRYLLHQGDGYCWTAYPPGNLASRIERAKELKLTFLDDMLQ